MQNRVWTRAEIENLLRNNNMAVEKGIVAIFERQTADEQESESTNHHNNIGFCGWAARNGTYYAKWVKSGRRLTGSHLEKARNIALHHAGQLTKIANKQI
jgi:hypothetical protein